MEEERVYLDEPCVVSFFIGELGWFLQRWQGYLRYLKTQKYKDRKFFLMIPRAYHVFVQDFAWATIDLPKEFKALNLETDCYEAPHIGSEAGSLTPSTVRTALIDYFRNFYNGKKAYEVWTPRGSSTDWIDRKPQVFTKYSSDPINLPKPCVCVFPRGRARAAFRNVPEYVWKELVDTLKQENIVVLCGTPDGACLGDYPPDPSVINLINYDGNDRTEKVLQYLNTASCSISSQSGGTHISIFSGCPTYIIGHERFRHAIKENRVGTAVSFRTVPDYRAIDAETILKDISSFMESMAKKAGPQAVLDNENQKPYVVLTRLGHDSGVVIADENGDVAVDFLHFTNVKKLYVIDTGSDVLKSRTSLFGDRIEIVEKDPDNIPDDIDFAYIGPSESMKDDLSTYFNKLRYGGYLFSDSFSDQSVQTAVFNSVFGHNIFAQDNDLWWLKKPGILRDSFKELVSKNKLVGAEIGVYMGNNSRSILENLDIEKLYLIDPYRENAAGVVGDANILKIQEHAKSILEPWKDKIVWLQYPSSEAARFIEEELDFVYIDGNHEYEYVLDDINTYKAKLKQDGHIAGHDYENEGVMKAVHEVFETNVVSAVDPNDHRTTEWWQKEISYEQMLSEDVHALGNILRTDYEKV